MSGETMISAEDLASRIREATVRLGDMAAEAESPERASHLRSKVEGMSVALSYTLEAKMAAEAQGGGNGGNLDDDFDLTGHHENEAVMWATTASDFFGDSKLDLATTAARIAELNLALAGHFRNRDEEGK